MSGTDVYALGSPLFDQVTLKVPGRADFTLTARDNGPQRPYIHQAKWNGQAYDKVYLTHGQIVQGGELQLEMSSSPEYHWGNTPEQRPPAGMPATAPQ